MSKSAKVEFPCKNCGQPVRVLAAPYRSDETGFWHYNCDSDAVDPIEHERAEWAIRGALIALGVDAAPVTVRSITDLATTVSAAGRAIVAAREAPVGHRVFAMLDVLRGKEAAE